MRALRIGESRAGDGAQREHAGAADPPWQGTVDQARAMQNPGARHGTEHQAAGKPHALHGDGRGGRHRHERCANSTSEACGRGSRHDRRPDRRSEQRKSGRKSEHDQKHAHDLHDGNPAHVGAEARRTTPSPAPSSPGSRRAEPTADPSRAPDAVIGGYSEHDDRRHQEKRDADRPGRDASQRLRRDRPRPAKCRPAGSKGAQARSGTFMGRPASAATATASIEPETRPPGNPIRLKPSRRPPQ